jgi:NADH-quinone oxidoreductase subunit L
MIKHPLFFNSTYMEQIIFLIPLLPLIGFLINGLLGKKIPKTIVGIIATTMVFVPFVLSLLLFANLSHERTVFLQHLFSWIKFGSTEINFSFQVDALSAMMMLIITGIGTLIHLYSMSYMKDDEGFYKFFAYLNLFIFSMLLLVMGSNFIVLFFGWEGVGLCSYLLIGFWYKNIEYGKAARKAFIMNRIGDLGLLLGVFLIWNQFGSLEYQKVFELAATTGGSTTLTIATLCLFIGAMGKSAQIPLYTWLPDAMAGPTPVSALIHAATMVTAGIYMIVRCNVLFDACPDTLHFIAIIGIATSLFAAIIGLRQNDIKKVLAYSTVSQLGLLFLSLGVGAYTSAMFHLMTHAFFKALLFLAAGSVLHGLHHEQDIRKMGGLKKLMPITYWTFLIGTLAICGFPLFSGFFSKDEILADVFKESPFLWALALISATITSFYMLRLFLLTFHGTYRGTEEQKHHIHESPALITIPLIILAILSVIGGVFNLPPFMGESISHGLKHMLTPILGEHTEETLSYGLQAMLAGSTALALIIAYFYSKNKYIDKAEIPLIDQQQTGALKLIANKFYVDEIYDRLFVKPIEWTGEMFHKTIETKWIDGMVNGTGTLINKGSELFRWLQNGNIEYYLLGMTVGMVLIFLFKLLF